MMVESEAYELSEEEMLGAVNLPTTNPACYRPDHRHGRRCAKEPFDFQAADYSDLVAAVKAAGEEACAPHLQSQTSKSAPRSFRAVMHHKRLSEEHAKMRTWSCVEEA